MEDQIAQEIVKWMQAIGDTASTQAPALAEDIVRWGVWGSLYFFAVGVGLGFAARRVFPFCRSHFQLASTETDDSKSESHAIAATLLALLLTALVVPSAILCLEASEHFLMAFFSPKLYVAQEIADWLK